MTNNNKAMIIVDKLFELSEKDISVTFSGHCGEMVIAWGTELNEHAHISSHLQMKEQLQEIIRILHRIEDEKG